MKPFVLSLLALLASLSVGLARPIESTQTLADLGVSRPERLTGPNAQQDFYLPLPSRVFDAAASRLDVVVKPSPHLTPGSLVSVLVNDRPVDTVRVGKGGPLTLRAPMPPGTRADDPARNILKITVKGRLALRPDAVSAEPAMDREFTWIEVEPSSSFTIAFDDQSPDWLSVGRLAITLRPTISISVPDAASPAQIDLALKVASWVARNAPRSALQIPGAPPSEAADRFVIEAPVADKPPMEIATEGSTRIIHVRAGTPAEAGAAWRSLQAAEKMPLPGNRWADALVQQSSDPQNPGALLTDLDRSATTVVKGNGETSTTFHFDLAKLTRTPAHLALDLRGTLSPAAARHAAVFLNGRLVFSAAIAADATSFVFPVPLSAADLQATNAVTVTLFPTAESATPSFWQLAPESSIRVAGPAAAPAAAQNLLEAAPRFAAGSEYQVWLGSPADWPVAAYAVSWLQRVNPVPLLSPTLVPQPSGDVPAVVVGGLAGTMPAAVTAFPVSVADGRLVLESSASASRLSLAAGAGLGIWQLGALAKDTPALLVDAWGTDGATALQRMSAQLADSVWIETGDVVIGDGTSPVLTFATRIAPLPAPAELPQTLAAAPAASSSEPPIEAGADASAATSFANWQPYRWWVIGGLWLVLSAVVLWIFEQGRRRATH